VQRSAILYTKDRLDLVGTHPANDCRIVLCKHREDTECQECKKDAHGMHEVVERMIKVCKSFTNLNLQRQRSPLAPLRD